MTENLHIYFAVLDIGDHDACDINDSYVIKIFIGWIPTIARIIDDVISSLQFTYNINTDQLPLLASRRTAGFVMPLITSRKTLLLTVVFADFTVVFADFKAGFDKEELAELPLDEAAVVYPLAGLKREIAALLGL